ncbi:CubicO group peptidase (beta-lactamase class C family) [Metabacillus malikii]|uniref:CubicO group peptidase (Beta-lactamase class C family) n=1 Tax=Metabacillus malikii TaxID=1504265 RepID=A0ABT9ZDJ1_9BACI|nr:CubicO group peptidase (beta-lactamase class C family) [Metabacillus malikii]
MQRHCKKLICLLLIFTFILPINLALATEMNDKEKFEQKFDEFMKEAMEEHHVPGVTLSVVKDGKLFYKKGYGYSDLEKKTPVDEDDTLFRIGSVTKLFTVTSALALSDQGKLNLENDVNQYLDKYKIDYYQDKPILVKHLLTHTGGFDERASNILGPDVKTELLSLDEFLKEEMPVTFREPGQIM